MQSKSMLSIVNKCHLRVLIALADRRHLSFFADGCVYTKHMLGNVLEQWVSHVDICISYTMIANQCYLQASRTWKRQRYDYCSF